MKKGQLCAAVTLTATLLGSYTALPVQAKEQQAEIEPVKIAIFSDPHYYAPELGITGEAFEKYLAGDRKLLAESKAILEAALDDIMESDADVVLISGDLTKDGEKISHEQFAEQLKKVEKSGKKVYVIEGNHDIYNPHAVSFEGSKTKPVDHISPKEFKSIYKDFGYGEAIAKDPNSLSYVVEPSEGIRLIVMDSALYSTNLKDDYPKTGGAFSSSRFKWIENQIKEARSEGKLVLGMTHHGIIEHFSLQDEFFPDYVVKNWQTVSKRLADLGMKAVFTGHFHAHDIVKKETNNDRFLFDIETGSLVTYPSPYRFIEITDDYEMKISTKTVKEIDYDTDGKSFPEYSRQFLEDGLDKLVPAMLAELLIEQGVPQQEALKQAQQLAKKEIGNDLTIGDLLAGGMIAHYRGDEQTDKSLEMVIEQLIDSKDDMTRTLGEALDSLYHDTRPKDGKLTTDLETGKIK
ncbi:metallophosphoesterase family protein [Brevibacillus migulae]|uniref:metallophosphoesterase family protein n=1 Tax=Brevibacillus migulae TaxID=1644114 RepID=UPI00106EA3BB|nr:metallophosphoesterase [Brevibacillus migulae]